MFRKLERTTTSYKVNDFSDYIIDIVELSDEWEAWIYHKDYGVKEFMLGHLKKDKNNYPVSREMFIELVDASVNDNIDYYEDKYIYYGDLKKPAREFNGMKDVDIALQELAEKTGYTKEFLTVCIQELVNVGESYAEAFEQVEKIALEKAY